MAGYSGSSRKRAWQDWGGVVRAWREASALGHLPSGAGVGVASARQPFLQGQLCQAQSWGGDTFSWGQLAV